MSPSAPPRQTTGNFFLCIVKKRARGVPCLSQKIGTTFSTLFNCAKQPLRFIEALSARPAFLRVGATCSKGRFTPLNYGSQRSRRDRSSPVYLHRR